MKTNSLKVVKQNHKMPTKSFIFFDDNLVLCNNVLRSMKGIFRSKTLIERHIWWVWMKWSGGNVLIEAGAMVVTPQRAWGTVRTSKRRTKGPSLVVRVCSRDRRGLPQGRRFWPQPDLVGPDGNHLRSLFVNTSTWVLIVMSGAPGLLYNEGIERVNIIFSDL